MDSPVSTNTPPQPAPRWQKWLQNNVTENVFSVLVCLFLGMLCGASAFVLKWLVGHMAHLATKGFTAAWPNYLLLILPIIGILATVAICRYLLKYTPAHGTKCIISTLDSGHYRLRPSLMWASVLTSTVTLGLGGSAGGEGPIAYTGAALGSNIGKKLRLSPDLMRLMVGCGAAAGIAGIFKSPVGGAFFALEVLKMELSTAALMCLFTSAVAASLTCYVLTGFTLNTQMDVSIPMDPAWIGWAIALGIFGGIYSIYYAWINRSLGAWLEKLGNSWVRAVAGGGILALLLFCLPNLYGEGYGIIHKVINGDYAAVASGSVFEHMGATSALLLAGGATLLVKTFACSATNNSGGVAGEFAPTLFAGCIAGCFFAAACNQLFGAHLSVAHFALFGMAAVMAGVIRAPFMAIFLTCEMTGSFTYFLPVTLAAAVSLGIGHFYSHDRFFATTRQRFNGFLHEILKKRT